MKARSIIAAGLLVGVAFGAWRAARADYSIQTAYWTSDADPSGSCATDGLIHINTTTGTRRVCSSGTWAADPAPPADPWTQVCSTATVTDNAIATDTTITGLTLTVNASTNYKVECNFIVQTAAATTGVQIAVNGPASPTSLTWTRHYPSSGTGLLLTTSTTYNKSAATSGSTARATGDLLFMDLQNGGTSGSITFALGSEVDGSQVTVFQGSCCRIRTY